MTFQPAAFSRFGDVAVRLSVELGRTELPLRDVLMLGEGSTVTLDRLTDELLDVTANGRVIARGVGKGDVVAIMLRNSPSTVLAMLATVKCGAVAGMINYHQRGEVLGWQRRQHHHRARRLVVGGHGELAAQHGHLVLVRLLVAARLEGLLPLGEQVACIR